MNDFLTSVRDDLLDRRVRPFLALAVVALVAALAYAMLGGGGSSSPSPGVSPSAIPGQSGISVSASPANANQAVAEITSGASKQRGGAARNPFAPLAGTTKASSSSSSSSSSASGAASSSGAESGPLGPSGESLVPSTGTGGAVPVSPKETPPSKPRATYKVSALFGPAPPGTPAQSANLTPYDNLAFQQKLPSPQQRLLSFAGVSHDGKSALFKLVGEVIPHGPAECKPRPTECESIALQSSQTEELEYLAPGAGPVNYVLQVTITAASG
jgi:hypothetical protein